MQDGMGVVKHGRLIEVGSWCRPSGTGWSCVVWEGFLVEEALGPGCFFS